MIPGDRLFGYGKKGMKRNLLSDKRRAPAGHETREKAGEIKRMFSPSRTDRKTGKKSEIPILKSSFTQTQRQQRQPAPEPIVS